MGVHKAHWIQGLRGLATLGFGLTLMLAGGSNARAQVIEVHSDGSTTVFSGPAVITPQGVSAIAPKTENTLRATNPPAGIGIAIQGAANRHDVSARLVEAVARRESGLRQDAVSPKGARGVMQLMPVKIGRAHV